MKLSEKVNKASSTTLMSVCNCTTADLHRVWRFFFCELNVTLLYLAVSHTDEKGWDTPDYLILRATFKVEERRGRGAAPGTAGGAPSFPSSLPLLFPPTSVSRIVQGKNLCDRRRGRRRSLTSTRKLSETREAFRGNCHNLGLAR